MLPTDKGKNWQLENISSALWRHKTSNILLVINKIVEKNQFQEGNFDKGSKGSLVWSIFLLPVLYIDMLRYAGYDRDLYNTITEMDVMKNHIIIGDWLSRDRL